MDLEQLACLRTPAGQEALAAAAELADGDPLAAASALRTQGFAAQLATAALTQVRLRRRGRAKFGAAADGMFFTQAGLEQATRAVVAQRRARRLRAAGVRAIVDLGCGIGADLRSVVAENITGYGVERDPVTAWCAAANVPAAVVTCADALDFDLSSVDGAFCDPARRSDGRRIFRPSDYSPPWDWVSALPAQVPNTVLKLAPGIDQSLLPDRSELELVSVDGEVVEAAAWCGPLAQVPRRATILRGSAPSAVAPSVGVAPASGAVPTSHELIGSGTATAPVAPPRRYLFDPDGAVVRSHLVAEFAETVNGTLADPSIAYVWTDAASDTPFASCFEVTEVIPFSLKRLRAAVRTAGIGRLEILKRGSALDVEQLRRDLRLSGSASASLILTRAAGKPIAVLAQRAALPRP